MGVDKINIIAKVKQSNKMKKLKVSVLLIAAM